jgi:hypothetical protein
MFARRWKVQSFFASQNDTIAQRYNSRASPRGVLHKTKAYITYGQTLRQRKYCLIRRPTQLDFPCPGSIAPVIIAKVQSGIQKLVNVTWRKSRMLLVTGCQILRHQNDVSDLTSIDLCLRPSIDLAQQSFFVCWEDLHVFDKIGPDLLSIVAAKIAEAHRVANAGLESFIYTIYKISRQNQDSFVVFQLAKEY